MANPIGKKKIGLINKQEAPVLIANIVEQHLIENPPIGGLTIEQIKSDIDIADSLSKKHASGSDNQDLSHLVIKETGKGLSTNDYTDAEESKLAGIETGAQINANITKGEIEVKLIGELTSHTHPGGGGGLTQQQIEGLL